MIALGKQQRDKSEMKPHQFLWQYKIFCIEKPKYICILLILYSLKLNTLIKKTNTVNMESQVQKESDPE